MKQDVNNRERIQTGIERILIVDYFHKIYGFFLYMITIRLKFCNIEISF